MPGPGQPGQRTAVGWADFRCAAPLEQYGSTMYVSGIDASDQIQVYIEDSSVKVYLVARTKGSVIYYSTHVSVADPATETWQELDANDVSIPNGANDVILEVANSSISTDYKLCIRHGETAHYWNTDIGDGSISRGSPGSTMAISGSSTRRMRVWTCPSRLHTPDASRHSC